jgi:hypothetical protein
VGSAGSNPLAPTTTNNSKLTRLGQNGRETVRQGGVYDRQAELAETQSVDVVGLPGKPLSYTLQHDLVDYDRSPDE